MSAAAAPDAQPAGGPGPFPPAHGGGGGGPPPAAAQSKAKRTQFSSRSWMDSFRAPSDLVPTQMAKFEEIWALHPAERGSVKILGKVTPTPRWQQSYGMPYTFSGQTLFGGAVPPQLQDFLDWANTRSGYGGRFNELLVNWYEDGHHYIGPHGDDERQLAPGEPIISISLGATRKFRIRKKEASKAIVKDVEMPHGTVLVMGGNMQREFTHEVVKVGGDKGKGVGRRINITLRAFKADAATSAPAGSAAQRSTASHGSGSPGGSGGPAAKRQRT